ncbi:HlyD family type I secretion periplasmic adaptor subunit [Caulobacter soli]|uniref:HlyD family type I secretion periplasmic adaptor subunit n=1 Tax=Caulobacter soli TaxID=2708539 RepID=UPI0013ECDBE8|nr:HlyD family type I secretion periplasmic adaptor subunit [Caulobacter soli]
MLDTLKRHADIVAETLKLERETPVEREQRQATEFLPPALEILETPASPLGRAILWAVIIFLSIALAWAVIGQVDMVASAEGKLIPKGRIKLVQAADYGVVRAVHVVEGQAVRRGQPLVELSPTVTSAEVEQARQALRSAEIDVARASALVGHALDHKAVFVAPQGADPRTARLQQALVSARVREHEAAKAALRDEARQHSGDDGMVAAEIAKLQAQIPLAEEQLRGMDALAAKGYASRMKVSELRREVIGMRQDLVIRHREQSKAGAAQSGVAQQIAKLEGEFAREALDALTEAEATRRLRAEELKKALEKSSQTVLRASDDGVVQQLQVNTIGGVVKPADPLMVVVPRGEELVVEAMVLNRDAGFVRAGQKVEVKFEAYPFTRYGVVEGRLEQIGSDAVENEKLGPVYPARVRLSQTWIAVDGRKVLLEPGLAATAEIKTGQRRIIEYLLSPLVRRVSEAGRER